MNEAQDPDTVDLARYPFADEIDTRFLADKPQIKNVKDWRDAQAIIGSQKSVFQLMKVFVYSKLDDYQSLVYPIVVSDESN